MASSQAYWIYWSACFATVITWVFAMAATIDDAWVSFDGASSLELGEDCPLDDSICVRYDAATGFQFIATVIVSFALVVVVTAAFTSPPKTGLLGLALGIMLAVFSVFQMLAFSLMVAAVTELNNYLESENTFGLPLDNFKTGPTVGVAVTACLLGLAGTITILALRSQATNEEEGPFRKCMSGGGGMTGGASVKKPVEEGVPVPAA